MCPNDDADVEHEECGWKSVNVDPRNRLARLLHERSGLISTCVHGSPLYREIFEGRMGGPSDAAGLGVRCKRTS